MNTGVPRRITRRQILQGAALALGSIPASAILAACGAPAPAAAPTTAPAAPPATTKPPAAAATTARGSRNDQPAAAATTAPAAAAATTAPAAAAKPASGTRVTIRDHDWIQGNPGQQGDWYDAFIAKFEDEHPDIKVEREWFPRADMHAKELALAATGQIGDTVRINVAPLVAELQHQRHRARSRLAVAERSRSGSTNDQKQFWTGNIKTYTREGKVWGLPVVGHPGAVQYYVNTHDGPEGSASRCRPPTATGPSTTWQPSPRA